jgi:hypothetical protein
MFQLNAVRSGLKICNFMVTFDIDLDRRRDPLDISHAVSETPGIISLEVKHPPLPHFNKAC